MCSVFVPEMVVCGGEVAGPIGTREKETATKRKTVILPTQNLFIPPPPSTTCRASTRPAPSGHSPSYWPYHFPAKNNHFGYKYTARPIPSHSSSTCPWRWNRWRAPKRRLLELRRRGITQKKTYNTRLVSKSYSLTGVEQTSPGHNPPAVTHLASSYLFALPQFLYAIWVRRKKADAKLTLNFLLADKTYTSFHVTSDPQPTNQACTDIPVLVP
jgi:hypothetical protein